MPKGGSKPGERRGGRKAGIPNRTTLEREAHIAATQHASGMKLGKEIMQWASNWFFMQAGALAGGTLGPAVEDPKTRSAIADYLRTAASIAADLTPYESPRMAQIPVRRVPYDLSRLTDADLERLRGIVRSCTDGAGDRAGGETTRH